MSRCELDMSNDTGWEGDWPNLLVGAVKLPGCHPLPCLDRCRHTRGRFSYMSRGGGLRVGFKYCSFDTRHWRDYTFSRS